MQAPLFVRPLTEKEQAELEAGRRSSQGFTVRRSQMLLASAEGKPTTTIACLIGCTDKAVRNSIHDFHERGIAALQPKSSRPHTTHEVFDAEGRERLRALLHQSPRNFGKDTSIWTLDLAAEVSVEIGIASRLVSGETIHNALRQLGVRWKRAKHWITSPDPDYVRKKTRRDSLIRLVLAHPTWALGFLDEVWWSRLAQPDQHRWVQEDDLTRLQELELSKEDTDPKALACYGVLLRRRCQPADQMVLRFVDGRPGSSGHDRLLSSVVRRTRAASGSGPRAHLGQRFVAQESDGSHLDWGPQSGGQANWQRGAYPALPVPLQKSLAQSDGTESWVHGKRNVSEADHILSANELEARVCAYYGVPPEPHLLQPKKVA